MACHTLLLEEYLVIVSLLGSTGCKGIIFTEKTSFLKSLNMLGSEAAVSIPDSVADNAEQGEWNMD